MQACLVKLGQLTSSMLPAVRLQEMSNPEPARGDLQEESVFLVPY